MFIHRGGLILLGSSFARLKFNRSKLRELPLKAIFVRVDQLSGVVGVVTYVSSALLVIPTQASAIAKLLITPIIGIFMIIGFRENTTLFPRDQKSECMCVRQLRGVRRRILTYGHLLDTFSALLRRFHGVWDSQCSQVSRSCMTSRAWTPNALTSLVFSLPANSRSPRSSSKTANPSISSRLFCLYSVSRHAWCYGYELTRPPGAFEVF